MVKIILEIGNFSLMLLVQILTNYNLHHNNQMVIIGKSALI